MSASPKSDESREVHDLRNRLYSMELALQAAKNHLNRGNSEKALVAINAAIARLKQPRVEDLENLDETI